MANSTPKDQIIGRLKFVSPTQGDPHGGRVCHQCEVPIVTMATVMAQNEKKSNLTNSWAIIVISYIARQLKVHML